MYLNNHCTYAIKYDLILYHSLQLENLFRQSSVSDNFAGVQITSSEVDSTSNLYANFIMNLYFRTAAGVTQSDVQDAFDALLTNNKFDIDNGVDSADNFFVGMFPWQPIGTYTGWPPKNGTVDFLGLCSDQQLSTVNNNTKIIKFG